MRRFDRGKYNVPRNSRRGCLGRDGTYSVKNCNENDYFSQGIGRVTAIKNETEEN